MVFVLCWFFFSRNAGDSKGELGRHGDLDQQRHTAASMIEGDGEDGALVSGTHLLSPYTPSQGCMTRARSGWRRHMATQVTRGPWLE